ncbi:hypothetical protein WR25_02581 [Diploscapter pachys]|uniref:UDENN domain-containing protein n=1 Tax=Diploscapter pachys TaxID=2018661 RepID=A0A2A2LAI9_9BILA|nr:hypothetical protein WR25_02581 [Diploscapter pachys]
MQPILHVVVVGFHHKKGCQVEYSYPQLTGSGEGGLPDAWTNLPSLAMPDGAHNTEDDIIYFVLPANDDSNSTVFGISCYRQIAADKLLSKSEDVTRSTVQKSVCVLSRVPLYGVLKAKLQLITQAYFNERDFAKVEVLSQMYDNLCDMFSGEDLVDGQAASMDISVQDFFLRFRHKALLLFKLILLEKKILFYISPAQFLGDTMVSLVSLYPKLLEEGLQFCTARGSNSVESEQKEVSSQKDDGKASGPDPISTEDLEISVIDEPTDPLELLIPKSDEILKMDPFRDQKDNYGFPLSIFIEGNIFEPYLSIHSLDLIKSTKSFTIGATNALFSSKRDKLDILVTMENDVGQVEILNPGLRKAATLTTPDLRFCEQILKNIEENKKFSAIFEGSDEWIRFQLRSYLLSLAASARTGLQTAVADFGVNFIAEWRKTLNFQIWMVGRHDDLVGAVPGHICAGQYGIHDLYLRAEHTLSGSEGARKALTALGATGKNLGETGAKMKSNFTNWLQRSSNGVLAAGEAVEAKEGDQNVDEDTRSNASESSLARANSSLNGEDSATSSASRRLASLSAWIKGSGQPSSNTNSENGAGTATSPNEAQTASGEDLTSKVQSLKSWFKGKPKPDPAKPEESKSEKVEQS